MGAVAAGPDAAGKLLRRAAELSRTDAAAAYEVLYPRRRSAIKGLGPSFGTKFLYFAGGGDPGHPSLILDSYVAAALHGHGWTSLRGGGWPAWTCQRYCDLLSRWAAPLSIAGDRSSTGSSAARGVERRPRVPVLSRWPPRRRVVGR
jgi:hypothetical protein